MCFTSSNVFRQHELPITRQDMMMTVLELIRIDRPRFNKLLYCALSVLTFVSACSESPDSLSNRSANTGSIAFSIVLHETSSNRALTTPIDCDANGIETFEAYVYSQPNQLLRADESWPCSAHEGEITDVPPGTVNVCFLGKDSNGAILYRGKSNDIVVTAGEATGTVIVVCHDYKTVLSAPVNDASIVYLPGSLDFQWQPVTGASEYLIQISTDSNFETTEIAATIDDGSTSYTPTAPISAGTIYWRVRAIDEYGYEGDWSTTGNFSLTPGHTVTFTAGSNGSLIGETTQIVANGGDCTAVTADPANEYHFSYWSGDVPLAQINDNPLTLTNVTSDMNIQANFGLIQWSEITKLLPADISTQDWFGRSVSISGNYAIVGAPYEDVNGIKSGSAYIYKHEGGTWTQKQKIEPIDGESWAEFGYSVSISGDYALIGARMDDHDVTKSHEGSAYIFKRSGETWSQLKKLIATAPDPALPDGGGGPEGNGRFGFSVCINGEYAIVGAYRADPDGDGNPEGAAYIFSRDRGGTDNWGFHNMVNAKDYTDDDQFGYSVAISGDVALVGAPGDDDNGDASGSVYIFKRDPWWGWGEYHSLTTGPPHPPNYREHTEHYKIIASNGAALDQFGYSVSISAGYGMVGAPYVSGTGSVYVLEWDGFTWSEHSSIVPSDVLAGDEFGISVSSNDDRAIVGSWKTNNTGAAYILNRSGLVWSAGQKLLASDGEAGEFFGVSVSVSGDNAIVGAHYDDENGFEGGSAYVLNYY